MFVGLGTPGVDGCRGILAWTAVVATTVGQQRVATVFCPASGRALRFVLEATRFSSGFPNM